MTASENELLRRKELLRATKIDVSNKEWLYMLGAETRHSVAIEGIFTDEKELKAVIERSDSSPDIDQRVLNYFRAAQFLYDMALQYRNSNEKPSYILLIRTLHSQLHKNIATHYIAGEFRKGPVQITNAVIKPPFNPQKWIKLWAHYIDHTLENYFIHEAIARIHVLFEAIHPFYDGNGRVGRLIINFILIANNYTNIIIKGVEKSERDRYYKALEKADKGIVKLFERDKVPSLETLSTEIDKGDFNQLENIIYEAIIESSNRTLTMYEPENELLTVPEVAKKLNISQTAIKKRIKTGKIIASKLGTGTWRIPQKYLT
ncbi:MAG: Fic family protein [Kosmotoga sp.]|nr:MAG: Fic family protein [Kosmotoga sp.]